MLKKTRYAWRVPGVKAWGKIFGRNRTEIRKRGGKSHKRERVSGEGSSRKKREEIEKKHAVEGSTPLRGSRGERER